MSNPSESGKGELSSTYFVQDRRSKDELTRVTIQDQMVTSAMGGALPEQPDLNQFHHVLDIGCSTGGWAIEAARIAPAMSLTGIDISARMIEAARARAKSERFDRRVTFLVMDALRPLAFPPGSFDLVNIRMGGSFIRNWEWPSLLNELQRITPSGGIIRLTEADIVESSSIALNRLNDLLREAFFQAGNFFTPQKDGLTSQLVPLLTRYGLEDVQTHDHLLIFVAGTPEGEHFAEDMQYVFRTLRPYLEKWTRIPDDYDALYQRALVEMQHRNFRASWRYVTAWGHVARGES